MKGGLAAIMLAGAAAARAGLRGDVIVTAVADEEHASEGVQSVLRRWRADACIVTEPTHLRACVAHKGFVWAQLETRGPRGARLAPRPRRRRDRRHGARARRHPGAAAPPRGAAAPAARRGEPARLADRRRPGAVELSRALRARRRAADRCPASPRRTSSASCGSCSRSRARPIRGSRPSCAWGSCASRSRSTRRRASSTRYAPRPRARSAPSLRSSATIAWMDAAFTAAAGIPTVVFGPAAPAPTPSRSTPSSTASSSCTDVLARDRPPLLRVIDRRRTRRRSRGTPRATRRGRRGPASRSRRGRCTAPSTGYAPTPLHAAPALAGAVGLGAVLLKDESSRFGLPAFKALGAWWATAGPWPSAWAPGARHPPGRAARPRGAARR